MKTLNLYVKPKEFYWTRTRVIYGITITFGLLLYLKKQFSEKKDFDEFDLVLLVIVFGTYIVGLIMKLLTLGSSKIVYGNLIKNGIQLDFDKIKVQEKTFDIEHIRYLKIKGHDFEGLSDYDKTSFEPAISMGLENELIVILKDKTKYKFNFQRSFRNELHLAKDIFIHYYQIRILENEKYDLIDRLSLQNQEDKDRLIRNSK